jgi:hypothetical protein
MPELRRISGEEAMKIPCKIIYNTDDSVWYVEAPDIRVSAYGAIYVNRSIFHQGRQGRGLPCCMSFLPS